MHFDSHRVILDLQLCNTDLRIHRHPSLCCLEMLVDHLQYTNLPNGDQICQHSTFIIMVAKSDPHWAGCDLTGGKLGSLSSGRLGSPSILRSV